MEFSVELFQTLNRVIEEKASLEEIQETNDAFFIADLQDIHKKVLKWKELLPRVEPHYAVKCNDDVAVLSTLADLNIGFDCASKAELETILDLGVDPSRIIYANPCKQLSHIKVAAKNDVSLTTFDNTEELYKFAKVYPSANLVLRILPPDDTKSQCQLGMKYGAHPDNWYMLLNTAKNLNLNVVGVSFHVGSGCYDATAFSEAVELAKSAFNLGNELGFDFNLLDIGGGFPGHKGASITFEEIVVELNKSLDEYFPAGCGVRIISEPGRYFVASAFTLVVNVIAKRESNVDCDGNKSVMYYVNDGVYGSFNCLLYDHAEVAPTASCADGTPNCYTSSIWGPTCDGLDCINKNILLQELFIGDWLIYEDMGAYTGCASSTFNGMPRPKCHHVLINDSIENESELEDDEIEKFAPYYVVVEA